MGQPDQLAMPPGADPRQLSRHLGALHDTFVSSGSVDPALRPVVSDSWRRSVRSGLDPERSLAQLRLDEARLAEARATHPLAIAMPVIRRLLVEEAAEAGLLVAVSDAAGQLLWVEGDSVLRAQAETMHFLPGADWSEDSAGTNAPGTALALGRPVQIFGPEHLLRPVTPWSCSAAPIREPDTGAILGVLDLTGGPEVACPDPRPRACHRGRRRGGAEAQSSGRSLRRRCRAARQGLDRPTTRGPRTPLGPLLLPRNDDRAQPGRRR